MAFFRLLNRLVLAVERRLRVLHFASDCRLGNFDLSLARALLFNLTVHLFQIVFALETKSKLASQEMTD